MKIAVIGGGPAGIMAASSASLNGADVLLIEQNSYLGKKMGITGKGRCNITNACDIRDFIANIPVNGKFMHSAFYAFSNEDMINLLQRYGVETKIERGNRVFPASDKAKTVVDALKRYAKDSGVRAVQDKVLSVKKSDKGFLVNLEKHKKTIIADKVIIATGGASYTATGSTGDGYKFASLLGHTIVTPTPSLVPLTTSGDTAKSLMGLSLKNVAIKITDTNNKKLYEDFGEMLFTHFGVSGPVILSASSHIRDFSKKYILSIDLKPALSDEELDKRILRDFSRELNRDFINSLDELLPKKLIPVVVLLSGIPERKKVRDIKKAERLKLVQILKNFTLEINGTRPINEAIITSGGVSVKEINPKTMESKIVPGLYFAGEVIDVDAYTGGFNLQIAYSTGYLAGENAGKAEEY